MKTNEALGFARITGVGSYEVGVRGVKYRAWGHEWDSQRDISNEQAHHTVCGRGRTPEEAVDQMIEMAIISGRVEEPVHNQAMVCGLSQDEAETLRRELHDELAALDD